MPEKPKLSFGERLIDDSRASVYYNHTMGQVHAAKLRESAPELYEFEIGRQRDKSVGPRPAPMYQMAFKIEHFPRLVRRLQSVRDFLSILVRTRTGISDLTDRNDGAVWPGDFLKLQLEFCNRHGKRA